MKNVLNEGKMYILSKCYCELFFCSAQGEMHNLFISTTLEGYYRPIGYFW